MWAADRQSASLDAESFVRAWQWYADLIHVERVSPPLSAWAGLLAAHRALAAGRIAMTLRSGWVLEALVREAGAPDGTWRSVALPRWDGAPRQVPVNADYAAVSASTAEPVAAAELAWFLASKALDASNEPGIPAWMPAVETAAEQRRTDPATLLEAREAWTRPALDAPRASEVADALMPVLAAVIARGEPAAAHAPGLAARLTEIAQRPAQG